MSDEIQKEILDRLEILDSNLKLYLNLFKLVNADKIEEMKKDLLRDDFRKKVYELCDVSKSAKEIAENLTTKPQNANYHLNKLTSAGLLSYEVRGREKYYYKTIE